MLFALTFLTSQSHSLTFLSLCFCSWIIAITLTFYTIVYVAKEIAIELNSLSKTANMAGWRVGCVSGYSENIKAITKIKSNIDSGMFLGIQNAAIAALKLDRDWYNSLNQVYGLRRELFWKFAEKCN